MRWASSLTITPFALAAVASLSCGDTELDGVGGDAGTQDAQAATDSGMGPDAQIAVDTGVVADSGGAVDSGGAADAGPTDTGNPNCNYPGGATGSFMDGSVLTPYSWASSLDGMRVDRPLDLEQVHCNGDPNVDWSPFDLLLFVSIPAT